MPDQPCPRAPSDRRSIVERLRAAGCVFAEDEADVLVAHVDGIEAANAETLDRLVAERVSGVPLEHVVGWAAFCGERIVVEPGVFVPRPRTEFLVDCAAALVEPGDIVIELCCGSGAVATALHSRVGRLELHAADIDAAAVRCARRNLAPLGGHVYCGDLDAPLPAQLHGRVRLVVANAPYVPTDAISLLPHEARDHEPLVALDGGHDGLRIQQRVAAAAPSWLAQGGRLLIETSESQAEQTAALIEASGMTAEVMRSDDLDATVVIGQLLM
jgi:release factor glutamine methyltransferase